MRSPFQIVPLGPFVEQYRPTEPEANATPARVEVAMRLLAHLTDKTAAKAVANDVGFETVPGQTLHSDEEIVRRSACKMLARYFDGDLEPSKWEKDLADLDALETAGEEMATDGAVSSHQPAPDEEATYMHCPVCNTEMRETGRKNCPLCKGKGRKAIWVRPRVDPEDCCGGE